MDALRFRCTGCGNCCRNLRVAVTALDVARLAAATGTAAPTLVEWLAPDAVDMSGEPESFVELSEGRRLMVLAQSDGACALLDRDDSCSAYAARPRDCQTYPFDFEPPPRAGSSQRRLALLPLDGCEYAEDGDNDAVALAALDRLRFEELERYQAHVARWNRLAWHRRRLHQSVGPATEFLRFAFAAEPNAADEWPTESRHQPSTVKGDN
jgi:Fe-S-cluster containining protein